MSAWKQLQKNLWHSSALPFRRTEITEACQCRRAAEGGTSCGTEYCVNRSTLTECNPKECPCGDECQNQRIQRNSVPPTRIELLDGNKGYGLVAMEAIPPAVFVGEYLGEIITQGELSRRMKEDYAKMKHTYIMTYQEGLVIDATVRGGQARFMNHSCEPNCQTEKWMVRGETKVVIVSTRAIASGQELTYNYNLEWNGFARVRCECGAPSCVGWLGGLGGGKQQEPMMDSDEEAAELAVYQTDEFGTSTKVSQLDMEAREAEDMHNRAAKHQNTAARPMTRDAMIACGLEGPLDASVPPQQGDMDMEDLDIGTDEEDFGFDALLLEDTAAAAHASAAQAWVMHDDDEGTPRDLRQRCNGVVRARGSVDLFSSSGSGYQSSVYDRLQEDIRRSGDERHERIECEFNESMQSIFRMLDGLEQVL